jgi:hypothetical protein
MPCVFRKARYSLGNESKLTGTPSQIEWAEQIRLTVAQEFDRVSKVFQSQASNPDRAKTIGNPHDPRDP